MAEPLGCGARVRGRALPEGSLLHGGHFARPGRHGVFTSLTVIPQRLRSLCDPCLLWRPDILLRACLRKIRPRPAQALTRATWGDAFMVDPRRFIGAHLYMRGMHELPVCEVLFRLADKGDLAVDVGANIGVM